ncbi:ketopantoate reductase family protein [Treponema phagedenis]|uniref:Ketopantoate reductase family protein n=1 Tax=Treponema phagedenis TaxID=162 RepID=A0AAF1DBB1_TREPH|nr:2-dehydropantoate 2-reductase N-terminal domain-containing protein [Treponema phagedenis]EFW36513.1 ketopantoate reductase PanE/ApbA [Treponema phagedenis F0421]NVP23938.1 ketopantoate reductase family protein [Treponema phagedenis]QEJ96608.1 ketopantoate reductase family protein [Treponema phagedenis]QEJ99775.1 ketopantoate reductase family protein [Treponema phagedenis]QEK02394.1 ketopantoate reductase family protein [Treponema phagedenis]
MNILIYGAGVIGGYLAHVLCVSGHNVTILARGAWKKTLQEKGLVIRHRLQRKTTIDRPKIIESISSDAKYDAVFAVMQYQQMAEILDDLAAVSSPVVILVGNNMSAQIHEAHILQKTKTPKTVLFGFQATGGKRENGVLHCVRFGDGTLTLGGLHNEADETTKKKVTALFKSGNSAGDSTRNSKRKKYKLTWVNNMDAWYKSHLTLILPIAYLCYHVHCNLRNVNRLQIKQVLDVAGEACGLLKQLSYPILPKGMDAYFKPGAKRIITAALFWVMAKTSIGELAASDHCRHAVTEMESLDAAFDELRKKAADYKMPAFEDLRASIPDWARLHEIYKS